MCACSLPLPLSVVVVRMHLGSRHVMQKARKQKLQRLFKQGVSRVVKERAEEMDMMAKKGSLYVMDAFAGR